MRSCLEENSRPTARRTGPSRQPPRTPSGRVSPLHQGGAPLPPPRGRPQGAAVPPEPRLLGDRGRGMQIRGCSSAREPQSHSGCGISRLQCGESRFCSSVWCTPPEHSQRGQGRETWSERGPGHPECNMQDSRTVTATGGATVSLLGLLAKIKCSICSYQFNI